MKSMVLRISILLITGLMTVLFVTGCQEQTAGMTNSKQARLATIENAQLTELLEKAEAELNEQQAKLVECQNEKEKAIKRIEDAGKELMDFLIKHNTELEAENKKLKETLSRHKH